MNVNATRKDTIAFIEHYIRVLKRQETQDLDRGYDREHGGFIAINRNGDLIFTQNYYSAILAYIDPKTEVVSAPISGKNDIGEIVDFIYAE